MRQLFNVMRLHLQAFEADVCAEAVLYDLPSLNTVFGRSPSSAFATADSLDSEATLSFGPAPTRTTNGGSSGISPRDSAEDVSKPAAYDADFTFPAGSLTSSPSHGAAWAPVTGPFGFDPETDAVDVLALEREFSMVPPARSLMPTIPTSRPGGLVRSGPVKAEAAGGGPRLVQQTVSADVAVLEAVTDAGSDGIVRTESVAADLPDLAAVEMALPRLPTMAEAEGCLYTMSPVLWLDLSPPYRLKVSITELQCGSWSSELHPPVHDASFIVHVQSAAVFDAAPHTAALCPSFLLTPSSTTL